MRVRGYFVLFAAGLAVILLAASLQAVPGYMDAEYYYAGAQRLAAGMGATEPYLWNYLASPTQLPSPSFTYWMPMVSLLAAAGLKLAPGGHFWSARLLLILLAAGVPPLTAGLSYRLTGRGRMAWMAGVLALFPGFYLAYLPTTDAFGVYMLAGGLLFLLATKPIAPVNWPDRLQMVGLGLLAGCMHLARADGAVWLLAAFALAVYANWQERAARWRVLPASLILVLLGYAFLMGPWYARNLAQWGTLFAPGGSRTLWLTVYEQTMLYPPDLLTRQAWLSAGWPVIAGARWEALIANLQSTLAVQGGVVLLPFMLIGLWQMRHRLVVRLAAAMWLLTFGVMTLIFPFAGINGAYFHSGAAFQVLWWAAASLGIEVFVLWLARMRRWQRGQQVLRFFAVLLVVVGILLSAGIYFQRVAGSESDDSAWSSSDAHYHLVEARLVALGAQSDQRVMVNDPPGYYLASQRPAVVIPYGDETMLLAVARQFQIDYLVLEIQNPYQLLDLYNQHSRFTNLEYLDQVGRTKLYRVRWQVVQP